MSDLIIIVLIGISGIFVLSGQKQEKIEILKRIDELEKRLK